ncbi:PTS lactose/cellobiose transporter subunit IIA [Clostridium sp. JN-1]|jgi:PTS system cellobiose-specific IIA component|uniref:PTS lactose/cellobiose transporter subunit IIA n=1 Tax=Clostridium sp. JN-1 TaxID=2483110 RepID=UPI001A9B399E|nr:PTS lactose/cellobiose transporter subunit IIA [Clostridium sp. JN-1]
MMIDKNVKSKENETSINEDEYLTAFQLISVAGDARSNAMEAIQKAREFKFDEAEDLLKKSNETFIKSHDIQTSLLTNEANGKKNNINIILIHALDHLTMATIAIDGAKELISLYKMIYNLKSK